MPRQQQLCEDLFEQLLSNRPTIGDALHDILWDIARVRDPNIESTISNCPVQSWLAVHAIKPDATFINADTFAQILAKLKYIIKNVGMVQASRQQLEHPDGIIG